MTINIVNAAHVEAAAIQNTASGQSSVMSLVSQAVQQYDDQIESYSVELMSINVEKNSLNEQKNAVSAMKSEDALITDDDGVERYQLTREEYNDLEAIAKKYGVTLPDENICKTSGVPVDTLTAIEDKIETRTQDLNNTSELKLINFQSLMDSRKQAMMMLSNILSSDNSTKMAIIQNLKS